MAVAVGEGGRDSSGGGGSLAAVGGGRRRLGGSVRTISRHEHRVTGRTSAAATGQAAARTGPQAARGEAVRSAAGIRAAGAPAGGIRRRAGAGLAASADEDGRSRQNRTGPPTPPTGAPAAPPPTLCTDPPGPTVTRARKDWSRRRRRRATRHDGAQCLEMVRTPPMPTTAAAERRQCAPAPGCVPAALTVSASPSTGVPCPGVL